MSNSLWHPSDDELAEFVDEANPDRERILRHLDECESCAETVVAIRQARAPFGLIPQAAAQRSAQLKRLQAALAKQKALQAGQSEEDPKSDTGSGGPQAASNARAQWGLLGLAGGAWAAAQTMAGATPTLAGHDEPAHPDSTQPPSEYHQSPSEADSTSESTEHESPDFGTEGVITGPEPVSDSDEPDSLPGTPVQQADPFPGSTDVHWQQEEPPLEDPISPNDDSVDEV